MPQHSGQKAGMSLRWCERTDMPLPRAGYMAGVIQEKFIVAGGSYWAGGQKHWTAQVDLFDPSTNGWQRLSPMPSPRSDAAAVGIADSLYIFGGGAYGEAQNDVW